MTVERETPYHAFNYLVDLGTGDTGSIRAGFQQVDGLSAEITVAEYRNGNEKTNRPRKVPGLYSVGDVTLQRGLIGALDLWNWITEVRNGNQEAPRNVTVELQDEEHSETVMSWRLKNAFPTSYTAPTLDATSSDSVAVEELVLACEDLEIE